MDQPNNESITGTISNRERSVSPLDDPIELSASHEPFERGLHPVALLHVVDAPVEHLVDERDEIDENSPKRPLDESTDDEGALCPICLDNWTTNGEHRLCSLKCGHLFGYKCVRRWINQGKRICPTCKKRVLRGDIRYIYAKKIVAVDNSEMERIRKEMETVTDERNRAQLEVATYACREHLLNREIAQLKTQLNHFNAIQNQTNPKMFNATSSFDTVRLYMDKSVDICKHGESRVFDANCRLDMLMASMRSPTNLYSGYGLRKMNISCYKSLTFIPIHSLQIRDICFHPENNWILTASMDKTFKVTDNVCNSVTHHFNHQMPLWSCCWDASNPYILYVGTQSGVVIKYDIRQLTEPICSFTIQGDMSPVVSLASIPSSPGENIDQGGVISCKLNSLWFFENSCAGYTKHPLSLDGPFISMKYQPSSKQLLVSSRPNNHVMFSRHTLGTLVQQNGKIDCNIRFMFRGGGMQKLLSRSCFLTHNTDYIAAHQENCQSVFLWNVNSGEKVCSVPAHNTVLDLKGLQTSCGNYLLSLTDKKLEFFKFI